MLFVEDEPALRISYERFFRPRYAMAFASAGAEALTRSPSSRRTWWCSTCGSPTPTGWTCSAASATPDRGLPVIITTAYVSVEPQLHVLDLAHSAYLIKPFDLDELGAAIDRAG